MKSNRKEDGNGPHKKANDAFQNVSKLQKGQQNGYQANRASTSQKSVADYKQSFSSFKQYLKNRHVERQLQGGDNAEVDQEVNVQKDNRASDAEESAKELLKRQISDKTIAQRAQNQSDAKDNQMRKTEKNLKGRLMREILAAPAKKLSNDQAFSTNRSGGFQQPFHKRKIRVRQDAHDERQGAGRTGRDFKEADRASSGSIDLKKQVEEVAEKAEANQGLKLVKPAYSSGHARPEASPIPNFKKEGLEANNIQQES